MGTIKDVYDILKDLRSLAKEANNQPMIELAVSIQDNLFDIKDEMQSLKEKNMELEKELQNANSIIIDLNNQLIDYQAIKAQLKEYTQQNDLAFDDAEVILHFTEIHVMYTFDTVFHKKELKLTLSEIFKNISLKMISPVSDWQFIESFSTLCEGYEVDEKEALQLKAQFLALGLLDIKTNKKDEEVISLTSKGLTEMKKLNTIKRGVN